MNKTFKIIVTDKDIYITYEIKYLTENKIDFIDLLTNQEILLFSHRIEEIITPIGVGFSIRILEKFCFKTKNFIIKDKESNKINIDYIKNNLYKYNYILVYLEKKNLLKEKNLIFNFIKSENELKENELKIKKENILLKLKLKEN
jgi:hypothetical protein